jgi:hypothetical protein
MATRGRYRTDENTDLIDRIQALEERLSKLERTNQLSAAAINTGNLTLTGGGLVVYRDNDTSKGTITVGSDVDLFGQPGMIISMYRSNEVETIQNDNTGAAMIRMTTVEGESVGAKFSTYEVFDKSGYTLIADSGNARMGFSDPVLHTAWWGPNDYITSTSGTFAAIAQTFWYQYHPNLRIEGWTQNDVGTTSDLKVVDLNSGITLVTQTGIGSGIVPFDLVIDRLLTANGTTSNRNVEWLEVQHRRASGAGNAKTLIASMVGIDLS